MQVLVDNQVIHYEKTGSGPTIVLVHGWADSLSSFYDLQYTLSKNNEVISIDLPGFGQSSEPSEAWTLNDYADCLTTFVKKLKLQVEAYIGHSNGGAILIHGLANQKLKAKKLILLSSAGIRSQQRIKKQAIKTVAKSGKLLTAVLPKNMKSSIRQKFHGVIGSDMLVAPHMQETFKLIVGQDIQNDARILSIPTLLIYGQDDKDTPPKYGELLGRLIPNSQLSIISNAGHFVHHDQPIQVERLVKDFLG